MSSKGLLVLLMEANVAASHLDFQMRSGVGSLARQFWRAGTQYFNSMQIVVKWEVIIPFSL